MGEPFFQKREFMDEHRFCVYSSNYNLYGDMSDRVMTTIKKYANEVEVYSIDECFVDFSNIPDEELEDRLHLIRNEVKRLTGIPVSIGVGPNKTLAKLTSHIAKKQPSYDGICSYWALPNFRHRRSVRYGVRLIHPKDDECKRFKDQDGTSRGVLSSCSEDTEIKEEYCIHTFIWSRH
jgi:hypothetical protein